MYRILSPVALFVLGCLGGIRAVGIVSLFCSYQLNPGYLGSHLFFTWISNTRCSMGYLIEVVGFSIRELLCNLKGAIFVWEIKSTWKEKLSCIANSESQNPVYNYALLVDLLTYTYLTAMVIKQMKQFKEPSSQISPRTRSFQWIFYYSLLILKTWQGLWFPYYSLTFFVGTREMVGCVFFSVIFRTLWTIPFIKLFLFLTFLFLIIACWEEQ